MSIGVLAAGGGHGTYLPAALLFPFTMLLASFTSSIAAPAVALAVLQFPAYGYLAGRAVSGRMARVALAIAAVHGASALCALWLLRGSAFA